MELGVHEGQRVKAGDLLAQVSADKLDAAVQRDQAGLEGAEAKRRELDRGSRAEDIAQGQARVHDAAALNLQAEALAELKAGARIEERQAGQSAARQAGAVLRQSRIQAGFLEVRAPFDGVVIHRLREPGSVLTLGQPILTLARRDELWVRVYLPQPLQAHAALGMPVTVSVPGGSAAPLHATLDEVASEAEFTPKMVESREERVNLVYAARVNLKDGWDKGLVPGVAVDVRLGAPTR